MSPARLALLLLLAGAARAAVVDAPDGFGHELRADATRVQLGAPFELTVVRRWPADHDALPFEAEALAPLRVATLREHERREDGTVEQRLVLRAWALRPGPLRVDDVRFTVRPRDGRPAREVRAPALELEIASVLPEEDAGALEWPAPLSEPPGSGLHWWLLGLVLAVLVGSAVRARRERTRLEDAGPQVPAPVSRARRRWAELARRDEAGPAPAHVEQAHAVLREVLRDGLGLRVRERTTPELLRDPALAAGLAPDARERLGRLLRAADLARFADQAPVGSARAAWWADGAALIDAAERALLAHEAGGPP